MSRKTKKASSRSHSTIAQHKRQGKHLVPPILQGPEMQLQSWINERLPEMLWAALLIAYLTRDPALGTVRDAAEYAEKFRDSEGQVDLSLSGLARLDSKSIDDIVGILTSNPDRRRALRPLALFEDLPARDHWVRALDAPDAEEDWELLKVAVAETLDHGSQPATDCRWARVIFKLLAGKIHFTKPEQREMAEGIFYYPHRGDMGKVGPTVRAFEGALNSLEGIEQRWPGKFWSQCLRGTGCVSIALPVHHAHASVGTSLQVVKDAYARVVEHANQTRTTTAADARHEITFGLGLYSLSLLLELLRIGAAQSISARMLLRTLLDCAVTLAYLAKRDSEELWRSYRVYGAGQIKLAFLKLDESDDQVGYVNVETLRRLANEDMWQEFVPVDLGHWDNSNLRKMSEEVGLKAEYDNYYSWTSAFSHGHWGAVRDTVFDTCGNPLHRLHRIPRPIPQTQEDVVTDACHLVDLALENVSALYPGFAQRVTIRHGGSAA